MERVAEKKRDRKAKARDIDEHLEGLFADASPLAIPVPEISEAKDCTTSRKVKEISCFITLNVSFHSIP